MEQPNNQNDLFNDISEPEQTVNYLYRAIMAVIGGLIGVAIWLVPVYFFDYILFITVIAVGIGAGAGAKGFSSKKGSIVLAIIAILATAVCLLIGDYLETAIVLEKFNLPFEMYLDFIPLRFEDDPKQVFYYVGALGIAGFTAFTTAK